MQNANLCSRFSVAFSLLTLCLAFGQAQAQLAPVEVGTTVNGFQDDFDGSSLNLPWAVRGASVYSVSGGQLHVTSTGGDPNHLLCELPGYNSSVQEVLARIRVNNFGSGDPPRAGLCTATDAATSRGINLMFRDEPAPGQRHIEFLDDTRAWGTELSVAWQNNTWYWLRLRHEPNSAALGGVNDVFGKIWKADGTEPEPAAWQITYDYTPSRSALTGFAGIAATSSGGTAEFDVDYVLIKAAGLPAILVSPSAFVQTPVAIVGQPQSVHALQCGVATFQIETTGTPAPTYQWYREGVALANATNASYTLTSVRPADAGGYRVVAQNVVSNVTQSVTSAVATLTVSTDLSPPTMAGALALGLAQVVVQFRERVSRSTATNKANYSVTNLAGTLTLTDAQLDGTETVVILTVSPMTDGATYTVVVNGVTDGCTGQNRIAANTTAVFAATAYTPVAIGNPLPAGAVQAVAGGLNVTAGGSDLGGTNDQFQFNYQARTGDFDVKVRVESLTLADAWSEAGLVAREDLTAGSRFASVMATPSVSGSYFQYRSVPNGATTLAGSFPVAYPNTWLRLRRAGNQFTAFAGFDGQNWTQLGGTSLTMAASISLGFAVSSHNTNQTTAAAFRDFANVTAPGLNTGPLPVEPLGQSSRRTSLVISEILFNPLDRADGRNLEFVELFNALGEPQDISGWRLDGAADYTFPPNTILPAGGFLVVAQSPADVQSVYGLTGVLGPFANTNSLPNDRGTIQLRQRTGAVFLEANYDTQPPWPIAADGAGHSLVLARPSYGEGNVEAWAASDAVGGSPGRLDPVTIDPLRQVVINEFLANSEPPDLDFVELYNHGNQSVDLSGCFLSDARNTNKFTVPPGTILPARGFIAFNESQLGFSLSSAGERIYFRNASGTRVLDAVRFEAQASGVSSGRSPDGAPTFSKLAAPTPGSRNRGPWLRDVVINEILYNPISGNSDDEFIELYNRGASAVDLSGWRLQDGVTFTLPAQTSVPPSGYLVIAHNAARLLARHPNLSANNTVGDYNGTLANGGERIALARPDLSYVTNNNVITTNVSYVVMDEVTYRDGGRWGRWSDGGGSSLELIDPRSDNRLAANWADSDETSKGRWSTVEARGVLDNGTSAADQLQVLLQGPGECLIDDVEVRTAAGVNLVANSSFESGSVGWTAEGTLEASGLEAGEGFASSRSYRVRAADRGDNQVNRIRTSLTAAPAAGSTNIIRARVRWLRGHPEVLFRLRGNWLEAAATMDLPMNLGTPGARNSRAVDNAPPAIFAVTHNPPVPAANEPVVVTARVNDPDGVAAVQLLYRLDPATALSAVAMVDDGSGGDAVAGDGLYSAQLPGQPAGTLVAFRVQATDGFSPGASATFPDNAPTRECLVRFGETVPAGNFPSYRLWMTQATFNTWDARNNLNNTLNDVTFVLGNHRVIYNAGASFAGSPYIAPGFSTPIAGRCGYAIEFPPDESFLGDTGLNLDWPGGHGNENTAIQEQMAYWIAERMNVPFSHRYFIRLTVNGVTDLQRGGVFEAALQPGSDFLKQWSPGDDAGDFFRIDRAFEFNDTGSLIADPEPQLLLYTTPDLVNGGRKKKTEKYRWYWLKRSFASANDYTSVFAMADALNAPGPEPYTAHTEALADVEEWMGIFAAEHIINNFDSWGHDIGKNMYMYFPKNGRAQLYMFDLDWLMLVAAGSYPPNPGASSGQLFVCDDPAITRLYAQPPFRRAYFRAVEKAVNNAFIPARYEAAMDAKYASLLANGITQCDGQALVAPTAVKTWFNQRRTYLAGQLATLGAPFAITNNGGNDFTVATNFLTLAGTAPIGVKGIRVNGSDYAVTWTTVSNWTMRLLLDPGATSLQLDAYDNAGVALPGLTRQLTITSTAPGDTPEGHLVINEILYHPLEPDAEFVEILNTSTTTAFDLSGWRLNGVGFTFPAGTLIASGGYLVVCRDRTAFGNAYGWAIPVAGEYDGQLDDDGETLSLIKPGVTPEQDQIIDTVRYDADLPWPRGTNNIATASSIQLIDAAQDNRRSLNWSTFYRPPEYGLPIDFPGATNAGWRRVIFTSVLSTNAPLNFWFYLGAAGDVYIDDVTLVAGTVPGVGENLLQNGDFESPLGPAWAALGNYSNTVVSTELSHSGQASLHVIASGNFGQTSLVRQTIPSPSTTNTPYTLSYWFYSTANAQTLNARTFPGTAFQSSTNTQVQILPPFSLPAPLLAPAVLNPTPGSNNVDTAALPAIPTVWINELLPNNLTGLTDNAGDRDPWVEIYNAGSNTVSLVGWSLTDNYTNLTRWAFPAGASLEPGQFRLIWLDGEPGETSGNAWHASFRASPTNGSLALVLPFRGAPTVLDYVNYRLASPDRSIGFYPDGEPGPRATFIQPTPGAGNNPAAPPVNVVINEWMAANASFVLDPTDGVFDDWIELYNAGSAPADLSGYSLSDRLTGPGGRWNLPAGTVIPARSFLFIWADEDTARNGTDPNALHAGFKLSQGGEAIGLFAPDGTVVDAVTFGPQTNNVSQGRWPDGSASIFSMTTPTPRAANVLATQPPAEIRIVTAGLAPNGDLILSWTAEIGKTYRLEFKDDLGTAGWTALTELTATGPTVSLSIPRGSAPRRFFRIQGLAP